MSFRSFTIAAACLAALTPPLSPIPTSPFFTSAKIPLRRRCGTRSRPTTTPRTKGVNVQFKYLENEAFKAKLPTMLQSNDSRPELFYSGPAA